MRPLTWVLVPMR